MTPDLICPAMVSLIWSYKGWEPAREDGIAPSIGHGMVYVKSGNGLVVVRSGLEW